MSGSSMGSPAVFGRAAAAWLRLPHAVRALAPIAVMAALWWSSSRSLQSSDGGAWRGLLQNSAHIVAYAVLAAAVWLAWARAPLAERQSGRAPVAWLIAALYGAVDEVHQSFVPGRTASIVDLGTDMCGAACAVFALAALLLRSAGAARNAALCFVLGCASAVLATFGPW